MQSYARKVMVRVAPKKAGLRITLPSWLYRMMSASMHHIRGKKWLNFKRTEGGFRAWLSAEPDPSADFYAKQLGTAMFFLPRALAEAYGIAEGVYRAEVRVGDGIEIHININRGREGQESGQRDT